MDLFVWVSPGGFLIDIVHIVLAAGSRVDLGFPSLDAEDQAAVTGCMQWGGGEYEV